MIATQPPQLPRIMWVNVERHPLLGAFPDFEWAHIPEWYKTPFSRDNVLWTGSSRASATTIRPQTALEMLETTPDAEVYLKPSSRYASPSMQVLSLLPHAGMFLAVCWDGSNITTATLAPDQALIVK